MDHSTFGRKKTKKKKKKKKKKKNQNQKATNTWSTMDPDPVRPSFVAERLRAALPDKLYVIYPHRGALFFIRVAGYDTALGAGGLVARVAGAVAGKVTSRRTRHGLSQVRHDAVEADRASTEPLDERVRRSGASRAVTAEDVRRMELRPVPRWDMRSGGAIGRLTIAFAAGGTWEMDLLCAEECRRAVACLTGYLPAKFFIYPSYDAAKGDFSRVGTAAAVAVAERCVVS
jgi:hypothetical protein